MYVGVFVVYQTAEGRKYFLDHFGRRWRVFVSTQIDDDPRDVAQEGQGDVWVDEGNQRLHDSQADDVVAALRPIACPTQNRG